jgi:hypothetical protein
MTRFVASSPVRLGVGLILALLVGDVLSPSQARAGCGNHLVVVLDEGGTGDSPLPFPPGPCTGPNCSRSEELPLAPAAANPTLTRLKASLPELPDDARPVLAGWLRTSETDRSVHAATPPFHPPR